MASEEVAIYEAGIFRKDEYRYDCRVCFKKPESFESSWRQHLESEEHRHAYKNYKKYFSDDTGFSMRCKICADMKVFWYQLMDHAVSHQIPPWYFPSIAGLRLFENFMLRGEGDDFYCYLCKKKFLFWWLADEHKTDAKHVGLRQLMYPDSQLAKFNLKKSCVDFYRQKRVFPLSDKMSWCWVCDEKILISNISKHCDELRHMAAKRRAVEFFEKQKKEKTPLEVVDESSNDDCSEHLWRYVGSKKMSNHLKLKSNELMKTASPPLKSGQRYACSICNIRLLEREHIELHINGSTHKNQLEKLKRKFEKKKNLDFYDLPIGVNADIDKFKCTLCRTNVLTFSDLIPHIESEYHLGNTGKIYDITSSSSNSGLPERIVTTKLHDVFFCLLCNCVVKGAKNITKHIRETHDRRRQEQHAEHLLNDTPRVKYKIPKEHREKARTTNEYPPEIKFIECEDSYHWCSICECALFTSSNFNSPDISMKIWRHIGGIYHAKNKKLQTSFRATEKNGTSEEMKLPESQENDDDLLNHEEIDSVTSEVKLTQGHLPKENNETNNNRKEFPDEILFIETERSSYLWCEICKCSLYSSEHSAYNSSKIWQHINGQNHRDNDAIHQKNQSASPVESTLENADGEKLCSLPIEQLMNVHVKDGKLSGVTCKPCDLYIQGEIEDDLVAKWHLHLETGAHKQKTHLFSINQVKP